MSKYNSVTGRLTSVLLAASLITYSGASMSFSLSKKITITAENAMFKGVETVSPSQKAVIEIRSVTLDDKISSSIARSPSLSSGYPDPVLVEGKVRFSSDESWSDKPVLLRLPKQEWDRISASVHDAIGVGIVETRAGYGLLCLEKLASHNDAANRAWLVNEACRKRWEK